MRASGTEERGGTRGAQSVFRSTVATPKVYHSGAQSVGCSWDARAPRRNTAETVGQERMRGRWDEGERRASRGEAGVQEGVGVPSYLVIYSPRAPGYPSRGITQGWACRAPGVSFRAGRFAISSGESRIAFDFPYLLAQTAPEGHRSDSMNRKGNRRYFFE